MRRTKTIARKAFYLGAAVAASVLLMKPPLIEKAFAQEKPAQVKLTKKQIIKQFKKAAASGDSAKVKEILGNNGSVIKKKTRINSLITASRKGHFEVVKLLLNDSTVSIDTETNKTDSLTAASCHGHLDIVKFLVDGGMGKDAKTTALITASSHGHVDIVKFLVEAGGDVNVFDMNSFYTKGSGWTPMVYAAMKGHIEVIEYFLEMGVDVDQGDAVGSTALMTAAFYGKTSVVEFLLLKGADPNATSDNGMTPLIAAAGNGQFNITKMLVADGAEVTAKGSDYGESALYFSVEKDFWKVAKYLISKGADVNVQTDFGVTPLMKAVAAGSKKCVNILLTNKADENLKDEDGWTALVYAVRGVETYETISETELEKMKKPQKKLYMQKVKYYETAIEIIEIMLSERKDSIDINAVDNKGRTALDHTDNPEVKELLKKYGAK